MEKKTVITDRLYRLNKKSLLTVIIEKRQYRFPNGNTDFDIKSENSRLKPVIPLWKTNGHYRSVVPIKLPIFLTVYIMIIDKSTNLLPFFIPDNTISFLYRCRWPVGGNITSPPHNWDIKEF